MKPIKFVGSTAGKVVGSAFKVVRVPVKFALESVADFVVSAVEGFQSVTKKQTTVKTTPVPKEESVVGEVDEYQL